MDYGYWGRLEDMMMVWFVYKIIVNRLGSDIVVEYVVVFVVFYLVFKEKGWWELILNLF